MILGFQYAFDNSKNVYAGLIQPETPYYQTSVSALRSRSESSRIALTSHSVTAWRSFALLDQLYLSRPLPI